MKLLLKTHAVTLKINLIVNPSALIYLLARSVEEKKTFLLPRRGLNHRSVVGNGFNRNTNGSLL